MTVRGRKSFSLAAIATGAIGVLSLVVGGIGVATAANGGSFILGHSNSTTATTTLSNSKGTPLSLKAKKGHAPLKVNSSKVVKKLNASELNGHSAASLRAKGSAAKLTNVLGTRTGVLLPSATAGSPAVLHPVAVVETAKLAAGTYEVTATAFGTRAFCWISTTPTTTTPAERTATATTPAQMAETQSLTVKAHQRAVEFCFTAETGAAGTTGGYIQDAGITAIAVASSSNGATGTVSPLPTPTLSAIAQP
jgi:hypothetical protein